MALRDAGSHLPYQLRDRSIYFSIVSLSTVGYGDIVPHSSLARLLASLEVICGFMLLLFGVSELLEEESQAAEHCLRSD